VTGEQFLQAHAIAKLALENKLPALSLQAMREAFRGGPPLFDAREWLADELLGDGHHLTGTGADAFTARLTRDALAPWLAAPAPGGAP